MFGVGAHLCASVTPKTLDVGRSLSLLFGTPETDGDRYRPLSHHHTRSRSDVRYTGPFLVSGRTLVPDHRGGSVRGPTGPPGSRFPPTPDGSKVSGTSMSRSHEMFQLGSSLKRPKRTGRRV